MYSISHTHRMKETEKKRHQYESFRGGTKLKPLTAVVHASSSVLDFCGVQCLISQSSLAN